MEVATILRDLNGKFFARAKRDGLQITSEPFTDPADAVAVIAPYLARSGDERSYEQRAQDLSLDLSRPDRTVFTDDNLIRTALKASKRTGAYLGGWYTDKAGKDTWRRFKVLDYVETYRWNSDDYVTAHDLDKDEPRTFLVDSFADVRWLS